MKVTATLCTALVATSLNATEPLKSDLEGQLPLGRWTGTVTSKTVPDVDNDGEWQTEVAWTNCAEGVLLQFKRDDGNYTPGFRMYPVYYQKIVLLLFAATENADRSGWSELQAWTLVDARPKAWTLSRSRAVVNQQMAPNEPWFTFRRFAWGTVEFDASWCSAPERTNRQ
jgi:hypothetical protein